MRVSSVALIACAAIAAACGGDAPNDDDRFDPAQLTPARDAITADGIMRHIEVLAHDSLEGRAPGSVGEERTIAYLTSEFERLGLEPGTPDGTWLQDVKLVGIQTRPSASVTGAAGTKRLAFPRDYVVGTRHPQETVSLESSDLVFAGYGVVAPEYDWDDFKDVDVRGKTVIVLINDPPVPSAGDSAALDPDVFKGAEMTYYGRWTYKYEMASAKGAAAVLIVHETEPAGYPYLVVVGSWGRENFDILSPGGVGNRVQVEGWLSRPAAEGLFTDAGLNFDSLKARAATRDFRPVPLDAQVSFNLTNTVREVDSRNVVAKLTGADPARQNEYVLFTAHWDHLGRDSMHGGDQIFNGALDNASGTATLLQLAGAYAALPERPARTMLFVALTAEEQGLLGAKWYAENPLYPLARTVANINMDGINQWGPTRDVTVVGKGNTTLEDMLGEVLARDGRTLTADPEPEKGYFFRSDHFELAKKGVPALYLDSGIDYIDQPADYGARKRAEYVTNDYHKPSDEIKPDWDLRGAEQDARALLEVGWRAAHVRTWPTWLPGAAFKAARDSSLAVNR